MPLVIDPEISNNVHKANNSKHYQEQVTGAIGTGHCGEEGDDPVAEHQTDIHADGFGRGCSAFQRGIHGTNGYGLNNGDAAAATDTINCGSDTNAYHSIGVCQHKACDDVSEHSGDKAIFDTELVGDFSEKRTGNPHDGTVDGGKNTNIGQIQFSAGEGYNIAAESSSINLEDQCDNKNREHLNTEQVAEFQILEGVFQRSILVPFACFDGNDECDHCTENINGSTGPESHGKTGLVRNIEGKSCSKSIGDHLAEEIEAGCGSELFLVHAFRDHDHAGNGDKSPADAAEDLNDIHPLEPCYKAEGCGNNANGQNAEGIHPLLIELVHDHSRERTHAQSGQSDDAADGSYQYFVKAQDLGAIAYKQGTNKLVSGAGQRVCNDQHDKCWCENRFLFGFDSLTHNDFSFYFNEASPAFKPV